MTANRKLKLAAGLGIALAAIVALPSVAFFALFWMNHSAAQTWRYIRGEPLATQRVNDAADWLLIGGRAKELEQVADDVAHEFGPRATDLPLAFMGDPLVPIERLPPKFLVLGGSWNLPTPERRAKHPPEFVLILDESKQVRAVEIQWGHRRHSVTVFMHPPLRAPKGFHTRKVTARIYVGAMES